MWSKVVGLAGQGRVHTLLLASCAIMCCQACGGRSGKDSAPGEGQTLPASVDPAGGAAGNAEGGTDEPPAAGTIPSPFPVSECDSTGWKSCHSLLGDISGTLVAIDGQDRLLIAGVARLGSSDDTVSAFIAKYSSDLRLVWLRPVESMQREVTSLVVDGEGNSFVAGRNHYDEAYSIAKVSRAGALLWTRPAPGMATDKTRATVGMATDAEGNLVVGGSDMTNVYLAKYSPDGDQLWKTTRPAVPEDGVTYLATDARGGIFVAVDWLAGSGEPWQPSDLEKRSPNGDLEWTTTLDGASVRGISSTQNGDAILLLDIPMVTLLRVSAKGDILSRKEDEHFWYSFGLAADPEGTAWFAGYKRDPPGAGCVAKYSAQAERLFLKDFELPDRGEVVTTVLRTSQGDALIVGFGLNKSLTVVQPQL